MAASESKLGALHEKVAEVLTVALDGNFIGYTEPDPETGETKPIVIPASAAIIAAATKFLKDNDITCARSDGNAIDELAKAAQARAEKRKARPTMTDLQAADDQSNFLRGLNS